MRIAYQRGRRAEATGGIQRNHHAQVGADAIGIAGDLVQPGRGDHVGIALAALGRQHIARLLLRVAQQLQQADVAVASQRAAQVAQVAHFERLDRHRGHAGIRVGLQGFHQQVFHRQADSLEVGAVLDLRHQPDPAPGAAGLLDQEGDDLVQRGNAELAVERGAAQLRQPLAGVQRFQLGQGEVFGEPALDAFAIDGLRGFALGELGMRGHVGGAADLVLVSRHQRAVLGHHQVRFDVVGAIGNGLGVRGQGVFGQQRAGAAVAVHRRLRRGRRGFSAHGSRWCHGQRQQQRTTPRRLRHCTPLLVPPAESAGPEKTCGIVTVRCYRGKNGCKCSPRVTSRYRSSRRSAPAGHPRSSAR